MNLANVNNRTLLCICMGLSLQMARAGSSLADTAYCPARGNNWEVRTPASVDMDSQHLDSAVRYALEHETSVSRDLGAYLAGRNTRPNEETVGPTQPRGDMNGLILRDGYIVKEFGNTQRVDMTFSVTKSFLSTMAALALDEGLIEDVHDPVGQYVRDGNFDGERNSRITWHQLLRQTSEWKGTLWGKPDTADRRKGKDRRLHDPGTFWEYNDVRVNLTSLALLRIWQRALPEVLAERVMQPIGASDDWQWHGYRTSRLEIAGKSVESVSGGGHWGGGLWIASRDQARFGLLFLRRGDWCGQRIFSADWVDMATEPGTVEPNYGYMWWVNTENRLWADVPAGGYAARGHGGNIIWVYPGERLVVVIRWLDRNHVNEFLHQVVASLLDSDQEVAP